MTASRGPGWTTGAGEGGWRRWLLPVALALGAVWAILLGFARPLFLDASGADRGPLAQWTALGAVVGGGGGLVVAACFRWPGFLRLPAGARLGRVAGRILAAGIGLALGIGALAGLVALATLPPAPTSPDPQRGVSVFAAAVWYAVLLAPPAVAPTTWIWTLRRRGRTDT